MRRGVRLASAVSYSPPTFVVEGSITVCIFQFIRSGSFDAPEQIPVFRFRRPALERVEKVRVEEMFKSTDSQRGAQIPERG
eukprot:6423945-Prymnesium_polylepis.1